MAWREMKSEVFGTILASGHKPINARSEAEKAFGSIFRKGRAVPVEYR